MTEHVYIAVQKRGVISLPPELRRRHRLDQPGAQVAVSEREDGVIELRPHVAVPAEQAWLWAQGWQEEQPQADSPPAPADGALD